MSTNVAFYDRLILYATLLERRIIRKSPSIHHHLASFAIRLECDLRADHFGTLIVRQTSQLSDGDVSWNTQSYRSGMQLFDLDIDLAF